MKVHLAIVCVSLMFIYSIFLPGTTGGHCDSGNLLFLSSGLLTNSLIKSSVCYLCIYVHNVK